MEYPTTNYRVKAAVVDIVVVLLIFVIASYAIDSVGGAPSWLRILILVGALYLYEPLMITMQGGTLGHTLMGLKVARFSDHRKKLNLLIAGLRFVIKYFLGTISILFCYIRKDNRALHDLICDSHVIFKKSFEVED